MFPKLDHLNLDLSDSSKTQIKQLSFLETDAFDKQSLDNLNKDNKSNTQGRSSDYKTIKSNHYFNDDIAVNS